MQSRVGPIPVSVSEISALFWVSVSASWEAALSIGIGIGSIGKGQYRHIGVSAKMWYRPIPSAKHTLLLFTKFVSFFLSLPYASVFPIFAYPFKLRISEKDSRCWPHIPVAPYTRVPPPQGFNMFVYTIVSVKRSAQSICQALAGNGGVLEVESFGQPANSVLGQLVQSVHV